MKPNTENEFACKVHVNSFGLEANSTFPASRITITRAKI